MAELEARNSRLVSPRKRALLEKPPLKVVAPPKESAWQDIPEDELLELIKILPGFDPFRDAEGCEFVPKLANGAIRFFETRLRHVEGAVAGKLFKLEPWQKSTLANMFGWVQQDDQGRTVRRFREVFIYVPRKNGKTPFCAGICLYVLFEDGEAGAQIVSAAAKRDQAALLFRHARGMVDRDMELTAKSQIFGGVGQRAIQLKADPASGYKVISAEAGGEHGGNLHLGIVDELHAQPNRDLVDVLQTSMASENRAQPLLVYITTADFNRPSICNEKHDYACKVRDGVFNDSRFLPVVFEVPRDADWTNPDVWSLANPNVGVSVSREYLERECKRAQETPTYENTFKRLHLNMQTEQDVRWLPMEKWDALCTDDPVLWREEAMDILAGRPCTGGLDLSTTQDLTAFVLYFNTEEHCTLLPFFWCPRDGAQQRERRDRVPYLTWEKQGFIKLTDGNVIDYDVVREDINKLGKVFNITKIARDPWNSSQITNQLMGDGFEMIDCGQGFKSLSEPSKELERLIIGSQLDHGNNPILRWNASNAAADTDAAGNIKPSKKKSTQRIDGIAATVMSIYADIGIDEYGSIYDTPGNLRL